RASARGAIAEEKIGDRVPGELTVEREPAPRGHLRQLLVPSILGLEPEPDVVAAFHPARCVRHAEDILGGPLCDATLAVPGIAAQREARTPVIDRVDGSGEILKPDVTHPVPSVEADRRIEVIGVVVSESDLVHYVLRDDPRVAHG